MDYGKTKTDRSPYQKIVIESISLLYHKIPRGMHYSYDVYQRELLTIFQHYRAGNRKPRTWRQAGIRGLE